MVSALVTGGTGFVGGRLAQSLVCERGIAVRAAMRRYAGAAALARLPIEVAPIASRDSRVLRRAVEGCRYVFHCAHDWARPEVNLELTVGLLEAAADAGVESFVYLSSYAAYYPSQAEVISEASELSPTDWGYVNNKREVTRAVLAAAARRGLRATVIEPVGVYGPFSSPFTIQPIHALRTGRVVVPPDSEGTCNLVFVDDLVRAITVAADSPAAAGERLIITGPDTISWREFYARYAAMIGCGAIEVMARSELAPLVDSATAAQRAQRLWRDPRWVLSSAAAGPVRQVVRRVIGDGAWRRTKRLVPLPLLVPGAEDLAFRWARATASGAKAERVMGFAPAIGIDDGMARTAEFVAWARL